MISVIVPVYKVEPYLKRCVDSLLNQDIAVPYEIILVDDGSPDACGRMCDQFQEEHPDKIRAFHKENGGLSSARNYGLQFARGEWISFVDSDDYVSGTYLSVLYRLATKFGADMSAISSEKTIDGNELLSYTNRFEDFYLNKRDSFFEIYVKRDISWSAWGKLYKKEILVNHPFPDGYYEDSASMYLFIHECSKVAFGDYKAEYHYLLREESITTSKFSQKHLRIFTVCEEIESYIEKVYPEWYYVSTLMYQNAVLQLINRTKMDRDQYRSVFLKYRKRFRKELFSILKRHEVNFKTKYYAVFLSTTPAIYRLQRKIMTAIRGERA